MKKRAKRILAVFMATTLTAAGVMPVFGEAGTDAFLEELEAKFIEPAQEYWPEARWWLAGSVK